MNNDVDKEEKLQNEYFKKMNKQNELYCMSEQMNDSRTIKQLDALF